MLIRILLLIPSGRLTTTHVTTPPQVDFADVRSVIENAGIGIVTIGRASGPDRAEEAADAALTSPLLGIELERVRGLAYSVMGGSSMTLQEVRRVGERLAATIDEDANVIFGAAVDEDLGERPA